MCVCVCVYSMYAFVLGTEVVKRSRTLTGRVVSSAGVVHDFILALIGVVLRLPVRLWDQNEHPVSRVPKVRTTDTHVSLTTCPWRRLDSIYSSTLPLSHTHAHTHTHTQAFTHTHTHMHSHTHTHMHTCIHTYYAHMHSHIHAHMHSHTCIHTHTYTHTYRHSHTHACTHTHTHAHTHTLTKNLEAAVAKDLSSRQSRNTSARRSYPGTPGGLEAQSGLTVGPAGKAQCQGGKMKPCRPHLHWSKPHQWGK